MVLPRVVLALGLLCAGAFAQSAPNQNQNPNQNPNQNAEPGTGNAEPLQLCGRIVAASTGDALTRARIGVVAEDVDVDAVLTDDEGRFAVLVRKPLDITLAITKAGYAAKRVRLTREQVKTRRAGEHPLDIGAAISGRVVEDAGEVVVGMAVTARRGDSPDLDAAPKQWSAETDDRGEYRIGGLPPGRYVIAAARADASPKISIDVKRGQEIGSLNIVLAPPRRSREDDLTLRALGEAAAQRARWGGRAAIQGRIVSDDGEPLGGAMVKLRRPGAAVHDAIADADGAFGLGSLPAGTYTLQGTKPGYVTVEYGQRRATETGKILHLRDGEVLRGLTLVLPRGSAIAGTIADEHGEPIEGATVRALQLRYGAGRTMALRVPGVRERKTDDRGQFRLFGLLPGKYLVSASVDAAVSSPMRGESHGYAASLYPGTADIREAWHVQLDVRRDMFGAHVVLAPAPAMRVSGFALTSDGRPLKGTVLLGTSQRSRAIALQPYTTAVGVDGSFLLRNVPPGEYVIQALEDPYGDKPAEFVSQLLTIAESDPAPITLTTVPGAKLEGRVIIEGETSRRPAGYLLSVFPANFDYAPLFGWGESLDVDQFGWVSQSGLFGPMRFVLDGAPPGWYLKAVRISGSDATDEPFFFMPRGIWYPDARFVISTNAARISGKVTDTADAPVSEYTVVVFPTDRSKWFNHSRYLKFARPSQDDTFEVGGLPPAEYFVAAVDSLDAMGGGGEWQDPAVLEKLAADARRVKLNEGDALDVTLKLVIRGAER